MNSIEVKEVTSQFASTCHGELIWRIFNGANMKKYSPVFDMSIEERSEQLKRNACSFSDNADFYRLVYSYGNANFGTVVLKNIESESGEKSGEIGFGILDVWQKKGLGPIMINDFVTHVFKLTDIEYLWATVSITNQPARKCIEKIGFTLTGTYNKPYVINGISVEQYVFKKYRTVNET